MGLKNGCIKVYFCKGIWGVSLLHGLKKTWRRLDFGFVWVFWTVFVANFFGNSLVFNTFAAGVCRTLLLSEETCLWYRFREGLLPNPPLGRLHNYSLKKLLEISHPIRHLDHFFCIKTKLFNLMFIKNQLGCDAFKLWNFTQWIFILLLVLLIILVF